MRKDALHHVSRELLFQLTMRYYITSSRMAITMLLKTEKIRCIDKEVEKLDPPKCW
jgi:hypothetical protein